MQILNSTGLYTQNLSHKIFRIRGAKLKDGPRFSHWQKELVGWSSEMGGDGGGSSGEEDGDASWRAAIDSVAALDFGSSASKPPAKSQKNSTDSVQDDSLEEQNQSRGSGLKLYQIKVTLLFSMCFDLDLVET